ncbi:MAG: PIN domain-containing protein [Verrucomicrobia bacterium]|nr:PIN domain-containing protein [Verrucomicrobiota bacterium]
MKLADINVWVALAVLEHSHHEQAVRWFDTITTPDSVAFCRTTQQGLLRLLSNKVIMARYRLPTVTNARASEVYESFLADDRVTFLEEPADFVPIWRKLGARNTASTKMWTDAYLAAFALVGGLELVTFDGDFRFYESLGLDLRLLQDS